MKKGFFLINAFSVNPNNDYKIKRLSEEFKAFKVTMDVHSSLTLKLTSKGDDLSFATDLSQYSFCINLDKDVYTAEALSKKIVLFNSFESLLLSDDKGRTLLNLKGTGVKSPMTIFAPLNYRGDKEKEEFFLKQLTSAIPFPIVAKENHGSLGQQVYLLKNEEELISFYQEKKHLPLIFEERVGKRGEDYRLIVVNKRVVAAMRRENDNDFRSNIALGGRGYDVTSTISEEFKDAAIKTASALKMDYAGIDIINNNGMPYVIEANGNAFFTEIEKVCNVNVAKYIAEMINERAKF